MTTLFPDFMDVASLSRITQGDVGALKASVAALDARVTGRVGAGVAAQLRVLQERHRALEARIEDASRGPQLNSTTIRRLKIEKLRLKDEMDRLNSQAD
jgi:hypothetical protein